jgi:hypothetical protein
VVRVGLFLLQASEAETALKDHGYGVDCELFGVCFDRGGFALLRFDTRLGQARKSALVCTQDGSLSVSGRELASIEELAHSKLDEGCETREGSRWANSNDSRVQKLRMLGQVASAMSSYVIGQSTVSSKNLGIMPPSVSQSEHPETPRTASYPISSLSGHSYCFVRQVQELYGSIDSFEWTKLLQWTLRLPSNTQFARDERSQNFDALQAMFVEAGKDFARKLITESFLPAEQRTLHPDSNFGGIAGGKKSRKGNQLFKFAEDVELGGGWLYGGSWGRDDRTAMKSAGREIQATQALIDAGMTQLNYPLMVIFTYKGKRVLCVLLLPVKGKGILIQGRDDVRSNDAICVPPEHVESVMATMGANLCIAKSTKKGAEIYGPFDMEIHQGDDGLLDMIDAARLFPPEYRHGVHLGTKQFYQLLRPELLRKVGKPLVPDALIWIGASLQT